MSTSVRVVELQAERDQRWSAYALTHPERTLYHHPLWLAVLKRTYDYKVLNLACEDEHGHLRGIVSLVPKRGLLLGQRLSSLPHTPVAGPLADDDQALTALLRAAMERVEGGSRLELRSFHGGLDQLVPGMARGYDAPTYVLRLPDDPQAVRFGGSRNHGAIKRAVKKAERAGVRIRPAEELPDLRSWYDLYLVTLRDHRSPPMPFRFFRAMWELLRPRGLMRVLLAEQATPNGSTLLAGSLFFLSGPTVTYAYNGRRRDALELRPNDALQWHAIHDAAKAGYRCYDFGDAGPNPTLAAFKTKWGAERTPLYLYQFPRLAGTALGPAEPSRSSKVAMRLRDVGWSRMPLKATAVVGDLVRHYA